MSHSPTKLWLFAPCLFMLSSCSDMTELSYYLSPQAPVEAIAQQSRSEWRVTIWQDPRLMDSELEQPWPDTAEANKLFDAMMAASKGHMGRLQSCSWIKTASKNIDLRLADGTNIQYEPQHDHIIYYHQNKMYQRAATSADKDFFNYIDGLIFAKESARYKGQFDQLSRSAQAGDMKAMVKLSTYYLYGYGTATDKQKAYQCLKQAADAGNHDAIEQLACAYYYYTNAKQYNLEQDRAQSYAYAQKLAAEGYKMDYGTIIRRIYEESKTAEGRP